VAGCREHGIEPTGSIKYLGNYCGTGGFLKKGSVLM
jgi:hypothetical protein